MYNPINQSLEAENAIRKSDFRIGFIFQFLQGAETVETLAPGRNGTKQLLKQYGDQLVCVRYRYDKVRQKRIKSIEIILDEYYWIPGAVIPPDRRVEIRIGFGEI